MTDQQLQDLFGPFGQVASAVVIMDKFTGRSKGFGFVEMQNDADAQKAISELNGSQVEGRAIVVSVARPREDRPQQGGYNRGNQGGGFGGGFNRNRDRR
ncbi:RNA-binding protein [Candidatus Daviesbacteria bacterium]|nr:RNA-binding protein [Candidatus Daviesbacteria bacterium]